MSRAYSKAVLVLQYGCFCPGYRLWQRTWPALAQLLKPEESVPKSNARVSEVEGSLGTDDMLVSTTLQHAITQFLSTELLTKHVGSARTKFVERVLRRVAGQTSGSYVAKFLRHANKHMYMLNTT